MRLKAERILGLTILDSSFGVSSSSFRSKLVRQQELCSLDCQRASAQEDGNLSQPLASRLVWHGLIVASNGAPF